VSDTVAAGPTRYPAVHAILAALLAELRRVLGDMLAGCYLYGSAATGDFVDGVSDVDLLAVLAADMNDAQNAALDALHQDFAGAHPAWDDRIEVAYVTVEALRTFRARSSVIAVISPSEPFHRKDAGIDWLANWYLVRETGITLAAPAPHTFIGPISQAEYVAAIDRYAQEGRARIAHTHQRKQQAYAILTLCRACRTLAASEYGSKARAASWAAQQWPQWSALIARALARRQAKDDASETTVPLEVRRFVAFALDAHARRRARAVQVSKLCRHLRTQGTAVSPVRRQ
jgi:hypothetical protein